MSPDKRKMAEVIQSQPDDASYKEIMYELAFERMIERGLDNLRKAEIKWTAEAEKGLHDI